MTHPTPARHPSAHGQFTLLRAYAAAPAKVYAAWTDPATKARWFIGPDQWQEIERTLDVRVGGLETLRGRFPDGREPLFTARYHVVEPDARLVYVYDMHMSGRHHSVSLATVEFTPAGSGCELRFTEQVVFVDGTDGREGTLSRERGTAAHIDRIGPLVA
jgi:uncharacterized protein YndB with AHSA1/START domain